MAEMKDMQGVEPMDDEELDAAVGGTGDPGMTPEKAKRMASAEGRPDKLDTRMSKLLCACDDAYKFCKKKPLYLSGGRTVGGYDISKMKCYQCGATSPTGR